MAMARILGAPGRGYDHAMPSKQTVPRAKPKPRGRPAGPQVKLGHVAPNGISASIYALIDRGVARRPRIAKGMRGTVEMRFKEAFAPVRVTFEESQVLVEDVDAAEKAPPAKPELVIRGSLPDVVQLTAAPLFGGVPKPTAARGRGALARVAGGRVRIEGSPLMARRLMRLLEI